MMQQIKSNAGIAISDFSMPYSIYPLCNYLHYGFLNESFVLYRSAGGALIARYDDSLTICSQKITKQDCIDLKSFIVNKKIRMLSGSKDTVAFFYSFFNDGVIENGYIASLSPLIKNEKNSIKCASTLEEYKNITNLVLNVNKTNISYYKYDQYLNQIYSRFKNNYCRNLYIKKGNEFIGHIATYAESDSAAVLGGLVVREDYRGQGIAKQLFETILSILTKENKESFLFCYNESLLSFYKRYSKETFPCSKVLYTF